MKKMVLFNVNLFNGQLLGSEKRMRLGMNLLKHLQMKIKYFEFVEPLL